MKKLNILPLWIFTLLSQDASYAETLDPERYIRDRHFISDTSSSFAIFKDKQGQKCHFVVETGTAPVVSNHAEFAPGTSCVNAVASTRLDKANMRYYLAMFKPDKGAQVVAILSVDPHGQVTAEKVLSYTINRTGPAKDIRSAKAALSEVLR